MSKLFLSIKALVLGLLASAASSYIVSSPPVVPSSIPRFSFATGLKNEVYQWRGQKIRYLVSGPADAEKFVLLVHGLFVNADHWRRTINALGDAGYRTYALDLLGSGYSSKPDPQSVEAKALNGENGRFASPSNDDQFNSFYRKKKREQSVRENVILGTASGGRRIARKQEMQHPLHSCYNFFTWAEQISDFTRDVIFDGTATNRSGKPKTTSLVGNSKGTICALQAVSDTPEYFDGVCCIDPTYREMHHAEMHFPAFTMPIVKMFQQFLRSKGKGLYSFATQRHFIKKMLKEPYSNVDAIDDELVTCLLEPLNLPDAAEVVFDELSYTTGPLFEQLLQDVNGTPASNRKHITVCYGEDDPWLSPRRVESLATAPFTQGCLPVVDEVVRIPDAGHCPHDERPEATNRIILDFLRSCKG